MRPMKRLIQFEDALRIALDRANPVTDKEKIPLASSSGRVVAEDITSRISVPPFSRSAMDGYAVKARETYGATKLDPVRLRLREKIYAGSVPRKAVRVGECSEIATGAMLPKGADAVVMVENTERDGEEILISDSVHPGQNVSKKGEDIVPGARIATIGELLNPSKVGAIAALGISRVTVFKKPLVAVVPTGNEVAEAGKPLKPGQVYNINSYTLSSVIVANGGEPRVLGIVNDSVGDLRKVVRENSDCHMIVFSGGSSVGERDVILDVIESEGSVLFHGIAVKPGKPTIFGIVRKQLVFGMPGYPTACLSNGYILLAPVLRRVARLPETVPMTTKAKMAKRVVSTTGRAQFLTVRLEHGFAYPAFKESGAITSMAFADGYIMIPADVDLVERNEEVLVYLL
ncbi:MAG TPA: gephyrin-like molybdotransferase Glp [Thermoplasmata archaeon]